MKVVPGFVFVVLISLSVVQAEPPVIKTRNGLVAGYSKVLDEGQQVHIYEGIPYGEPPVGALRFGKPRPALNWTGTYSATKYRAACMQHERSIPDDGIPETPLRSEDCLFLSIFKPADKSAQGPRPVMMWIHGGGFETGSIFSVAYDASYLASFGDVIVIPIQYRLGSFGFLYGGTEDAPGNAGLYDQILALEWIRDNIAQFGGNPNSVTIFGESAGGMSVGALVLSPLAKGLFHRGILQSGAPNSYLGSGSKEAGLAKTRALAHKGNCSQTDQKELIECLRKIPAKELVHLHSGARNNGETFEPVYGESLLPVKPSQALREAKFNPNLDLMFGTVNQEGSLFVEGIFPRQLDPDLGKNVTLGVEQAKFIIGFLFQLFKEKDWQEVADFYTQGMKDGDQVLVRQSISNAFGDYHLICPTTFFGQYYGYQSKNSVYSYRLVQPPTISVFFKCHGWMGVCHGDDIMYLFGFPIKLRGVTFTEADYHLSVDMINAWANFARTGKPTLEGATMSNGAKWEKAVDSVTKSAVKFMSLNATGYEMVDNFYARSCDQFWKAKILDN